MKENFMDGRNPQDKGDMARHGLKGKSIFALKRIRSSDKASKRKKQLAHWYINMHKEEVQEGKKPGLWDNIHAKRKRIKAGSNERMRKPGSKGAPTAADFKQASEEVSPATSVGNQSVAFPPGYKAPQVVVDRRRRKDQPPVLLKRFRKYIEDKVK